MHLEWEDKAFVIRLRHHESLQAISIIHCHYKTNYTYLGIYNLPAILS